MTAAHEVGRPSAREWLSEWATTGLRLRRRGAVLEPRELRRAKDVVLQRLGDLAPRTPPTFELEETKRRIASVWRRSKSLETVELRHLRRGAWVLFLPRDKPRSWLAQDVKLVEAWIEWLGYRGRFGTVVALLKEFLASYPTDLDAFEEIRGYLRRRLARDGSPRVVRWRERCERFSFLEVRGPEDMVEQWLKLEVGFDAFLQGGGLSPGLETARFVLIATERLLVAVEQALDADRDADTVCGRAFDWLERDGGLRFAEIKITVATAFLRPFVSAQPRADLRDSVQGFLCRVIGDPRIQRHRWSGVPDTIRNVLLRWLVGASLEDFFRVLDQSALDRHWLYRKAFWTAYLDRGVIDDAWVVLGPMAASIARGAFGTGAARLRLGANVEATHSVLLMRIGGLTIAEWSHNGACRIWRRGNKTAPALYEPEYARQDLVYGSDARVTHHGADRGTWQGTVAHFLEEETGIRIASGSYMPVRRRG